jgi:hypothetical protein
MTNTTLVLATGAHRSPVDPRDWTLASVGAPTSYPASRKLDTDWMIASMQGKIGCCVGCSGEEMVRQIIFLTTGKKCNPGTPDELSWRFVYALAKCMDGVQDQGTYPSLVAKIIRNYGVPLAKYCKNDVTLDHETFVYGRNINAILKEAFDDAKTRKSGADFAQSVSEEGIKKAINYAADNKGGVMILRQVGNTYWVAPDGTVTWDPKKILPIAPPHEITSGHEEFLTGYDYEPETGRMRIYWLNHWSPKWADNGRAWEYADVWMPYIVELRVVVTSVPVVDNFKYHFSKSLKRGDKGPDVVALQHVLKLEQCFPEGQSFTGNFGDITFAGVVALQQKYASEILAPVGLTHGSGFVGASTLKWLNSKYSN